MIVIDEADFTRTITGVQGADCLIVEGAEEDLEFAFEQQIEILVAVEGREQHFAGFQFAGAKLPEQLFEAACGDILEQSHLSEL